MRRADSGQAIEESLLTIALMSLVVLVVALGLADQIIAALQGLGGERAWFRSDGPVVPK